MEKTNLDNPCVLFEKSNFKVIKNSKNNFVFSFELINNTIDLTKLIDFSFIKLIYQLNSDIYESIIFKNINTNTITATIVIKPFFQDIGIPQKYLHITIEKIIDNDNNCIIFHYIPILNDICSEIPLGAEPICIKNLIIKCKSLSINHIKINTELILEDKVNIPIVIENFIGPIVFKIFNRIKQFIDNFKS